MKEKTDDVMFQGDAVEVLLNSMLEKVAELSSISEDRTTCNEEPTTSNWRSPRYIDLGNTSEEDEETENELLCISDDDSDKEFERIIQLSRRRPNSESKSHSEMEKNGAGLRSDPEYQHIPQIEKLQIHVNDDVEIEQLGTVTKHIEFIVVIKPRPNLSPLDFDSVLLDKDRNAIGQISEIFGPVVEPMYSIRFNSQDEVEKLPVGTEIFYAPKMDELTKRVFAEELIKKNWSDPGSEILSNGLEEEPDFSSDEAEQRYYAKKREQRKGDSRSKEKSSRPTKKRSRPNNLSGQPRASNPVYWQQQQASLMSHVQPLHPQASMFYGQYYGAPNYAPVYDYNAFGQIRFFPPVQSTSSPNAPINRMQFPPVFDTRYMSGQYRF